MVRRAILYVDYENAYLNAREVFHAGEPGFDSTNGHFHPWDLGKAICKTYNSRHPFEEPLSLFGVRVYRGVPTGRSSTGQRATRRRAESWRKAGSDVFLRPLEYIRERDKFVEKGVDMALGVDVVAMGIKGEYECAILFSADRDFLPALRYVRDETDAGVHVAAWGVRENGGFLSLPESSPFVHWVSKTMFGSVRDQTDYSRSKKSKKTKRRR